MFWIFFFAKPHGELNIDKQALSKEVNIWMAGSKWGAKESSIFIGFSFISCLSVDPTWKACNWRRWCYTLCLYPERACKLLPIQPIMHQCLSCFIAFSMLHDDTVGWYWVFIIPCILHWFFGIIPSGWIFNVMCWVLAGPLVRKGETKATSMGTCNALSRAICMGNCFTFWC